MHIWVFTMFLWLLSSTYASTYTCRGCCPVVPRRWSLRERSRHSVIFTGLSVAPQGAGWRGLRVPLLYQVHDVLGLTAAPVLVQRYHLAPFVVLSEMQIQTELRRRKVPIYSFCFCFVVSWRYSFWHIVSFCCCYDHLMKARKNHFGVCFFFQ